MTDARDAWEGTFECWRNRRFGELYSHLTGRRLIALDDHQVFVSHRPVIGSLTLYAYAPPAGSAWLPQVRQLARRVGVVQLWVYSCSPLSELTEYLVEEPKTLVVDLQGGEDELWSAIGPKTRNMIRRAQKRGVSVRCAEDEADFAQWWSIYIAVARRAGFAAQSRELVRALLDEEGLARLFVSSVDGRVIGGSLFLTNKYPMYWLGGVDREYGDFAPGHVNMWNALVYFEAQGYPLVDLGGIEAHEEGSTRFKKAFARDVRTAHVYRVPTRSLKARMLTVFQR